MKRYTDLTKEELSSLSDEQVQKYIDIEVAYAGILPVIEPNPLKSDEVGIKPTDTFYEVKGILFIHMEDAQKILEMETVSTIYHDNDYNYKYTKPDTSKHIEAVKYYKQEDIIRVKDIISKNYENKRRYNAELKEYSNYNKQISSIRTEVWDCVGEARSFMSKVLYAIQQYDKYLILTEGEEGIAIRFLEDAYKSDEEVLNKAKEEINKRREGINGSTEVA